MVEGEKATCKKKPVPVHLQKNNVASRGKRKEENLSEFYFVPAKKSRFRTTTREVTNIECFCGASQVRNGETVIGCQVCGLMQHRTCVNWNGQFEDDKYLCPQCCRKQPAVRSKTTLVIAPSSIRRQWYEEIKKHVRDTAMTVLIYDGVSKDGFIQPLTLATYDVVICTYETLRAEIRYADLQPNDRLRHVKRFSSPPSPLTAVEWWRICLDEAQMVEGVTTATADMCHRLHAVHRWCITGTPIQKTVMDLYGLISFLNVSPYTCKDVWNLLVWEPYKLHNNSTNLLNIVGQLMWRTEKSDVTQQLQIPHQNHQLYWYSFGPVEEHFYRRTRERLHKEINAVLNRFAHTDIALKDLDRHSVEMLMKPLRRLRKVCCHPQINNQGRLIPINHKVMSMQEVLDKMQKDTRRECKEEHRALVAGHNGLAGIYCLKQEWAFAAEQYREVMRSCVEHEGRVETDSLQRIHALFNLNCIIKLHRETIPPTLRDDDLEAQCAELEEKYLKQLRLVIADKQEEFKESSKLASESLKKLPEKSQQVWFMEILERARMADLDVEIVERVKTSLTDRAGPSDSHTDNKTDSLITFAASFRDTAGLRLQLSRETAKLRECREGAVSSIVQLDSIPEHDAQMNQQPRDCHLRPVDARIQHTGWGQLNRLLWQHRMDMTNWITRSH